MKRLSYITLVVAAAVLLLPGCDLFQGDDGSAGATGTPGVPGGEVTVFSLEITEVTVPSSGKPVVDFSAEGDGEPWPFLRDGDIAFNIVQLNEAANGNSSYWQNYVNTEESVEAGAWGDANTEVQATQESDGVLENNLDGTYTYTFSTNIKDVSDPVAVNYDSALTHRVGAQTGFTSGIPAANATYDFVPSSGDTTDIPTRNIVDTSSCNECHNELALHGGRRVTTELCTTCHNPGTTDANSGNVLDLKVMVHKIHRGRDLANGYEIWGHNDSLHDFSDVGLPMDIRNCTKCHDADDTTTADAGNWATTPTMEVCGSCHDDVDFATGTNHVTGGIQTDNSGCANSGCHGVGSTNDVANAHEIPSEIAAENFRYVMVSATYDTPSADMVRVLFYVDDPVSGDRYDVATDPYFASGNSARAAMLIGWDTADYHNEDSGEGPAQPISVTLQGAAVLNSGTCPTTCVFRLDVDLSGLTGATSSGSGVAALQGRVRVSDDGGSTYTVSVPVQSVVEYFAINDSTAQERRVAVDISETCNNCHVSLEMHGGNRANEAQVCVICHNPNATDMDVRPVGATFESGTTVNSVDGLRERSIDFKRLIHAIHGAAKREDPYVVYGFGSNPTVFDEDEVHFPGVLSRCITCHVAGAYELPISTDAQGATINTTPGLADSATAATAMGDASFDTKADNKRITPTASVCSACHDTSVAQTHIERMGGAFGVWNDGTSDVVTEATIGSTAARTEDCGTCHGPGRLADIAVMHGFSDEL